MAPFLFASGNANGTPLSSNSQVRSTLIWSGGLAVHGAGIEIEQVQAQSGGLKLELGLMPYRTNPCKYWSGR